MRLFRAALIAICLLIVAAPAVLGHAELDQASPGPGDTIDVVPDVLVATFTQDLEPSRSSMELRNAGGDVLARGEKVPSEAREMRMDLPRLEPGKYTVRYTTFSAEDNELERGSYTFTVLPPPATPEPTPTPTPTPSPTPSPTPAPTPAPTAAASATAAPTATSVPSPSATSSPTVAPTASPTLPPTAAPSPTASTDADPTADPSAVILPIAIALLAVGGLAVWTLRRRA